MPVFGTPSRRRRQNGGNSAPRFRIRGAGPDRSLEAEMRRRLEQSRRDKARSRGAPRGGRAKSAPHHHVPFGHPDYNLVFASGLQHGPVPRPSFSPGKAGFSYMPSHGSVSTSFTIQPGEYFLLFASPQCGSPFMAMTTPVSNGTQPLFCLPSTSVAINNETSALAFVDCDPGQFIPTGAQCSFLQWTGAIDPRTMVSGEEGPQGNTPDISGPQDSSSMVLSQFMGGRVHVEVTSSFNTIGTFAVLDAKSFPTSYGVKLPYFDCHSYNFGTTVDAAGQIAGGSEAVVENAREDFPRMYPSPLIWATAAAGAIVAPATLNTMYQTARRIPLVGGGTSSSGHSIMSLPPDGQGWFGYSGAPAGPPNPPFEINSASLGSAPRFNPIFYASLGQPVWMIRNDGATGTGAMVVQVNAELYYNTQVPTSGPTSVLNQTAVVATPHSPSTALVNSVAPLAHSAQAAEKQHVVASASRMVETRTVHPYPPIGVPPITPSVSGLSRAAAHDPMSTLASTLSKGLANPVEAATGLLKGALSDPVGALSSAFAFL